MSQPMQLPSNAWRNAKSYAADAFPDNGVAGDRIFRTDLGIWHTCMEIGGNFYWVPDPGTILAHATQTSLVTVGNAAEHITNLGNYLQNYDSWMAGSKFTPLVPGYYMVGGGVGFVSASTSSTTFRIIWVNKNSTTAEYTTANAVVGSGTILPPTSGLNVAHPVRNVPVYLNGSTDYVSLMARTNVTANTVPGATGSHVTSFWVKYVGPALP